MKKCNTCGKTRPLDDFYDLSQNRGKRGECKVCSNIATKNYRKYGTKNSGHLIDMTTNKLKALRDEIDVELYRRSKL